MAKPMHTPGVYIVEKNAFPNSVVEVETAVPAFIGYTQKAEYKGAKLWDKPTEISSLNEFHDLFGYGPQPLFSIGPATSNDSAETDADETVTTDEVDDDTDGEAEEGENQSSNEVLAPDGVDADPSTASVTWKGVSYNLKQVDKGYLLYASLRMFFANGGGKCYIVAVGDYSAAISGKALTNSIAPLVKEQVPTMLVIPDAMKLAPKEAKDVQITMLGHCGEMANRVAILDVPNGYLPLRDKPVDEFRTNVGTNSLKYGMAYYPWLESSLLNDRDIGLQHVQKGDDTFTGLVSAELTAKGMDADDVKKLMADVKEKEYTEDKLVELASSTEPEQQKDRDELVVLNDILRAQSELYGFVIKEIKDKLNLLPPSGAMAGIYTRVDNQRGVWQAPANVSLAMTNKPSQAISNEEQAKLNVDVKGKSVNAIREFLGEGTIVWGARTLDGNSLDWRYINVRRTMIMLEESIRLAAKAYVFEPNTANTWITMKGMISNFLTGIWKRGGLAGAVPEDAFSVHVGLGETMTSEDILEGILRITVLVAPTRPAEFIEITFQQQQQRS